MTREVELKSVVDDIDACRRRIEAAGPTLVFEGRLEDRRYDTIDGRLAQATMILRTRTIVAPGWIESIGGLEGIVERDERTGTRFERDRRPYDDPAELASIFERLGFGAPVRSIAKLLSISSAAPSSDSSAIRGWTCSWKSKGRLTRSSEQSAR